MADSDTATGKPFQYENLIAPIIDVLTRYGPVRVEVLTYLLRRDHSHVLPHLIEQNEVTYVLDSHLSDELMSFPTAARPNGIQDWCVRLKTQADMEPILAASNDYVKAYLDLFDLFQFVRANPEVVNVPLGMLQDLYARAAVTDGVGR